MVLGIISVVLLNKDSKERKLLSTVRSTGVPQFTDSGRRQIYLDCSNLLLDAENDGIVDDLSIQLSPDEPAYLFTDLQVLNPDNQAFTHWYKIDEETGASISITKGTSHGFDVIAGRIELGDGRIFVLHEDDNGILVDEMDEFEGDDIVEDMEVIEKRKLIESQIQKQVESHNRKLADVDLSHRHLEETATVKVLVSTGFCHIACIGRTISLLTSDVHEYRLPTPSTHFAVM